MTDNSIRLIIAGGRGFTDYNHMENVVDHMLSKLFETHEITIISGDAIGADKLGMRYASHRSLPLIVMPADWDKYGKSAGYRRNTEMANKATHLIAFWDGESRGTKHMIDIAHSMKIKVHVSRY